MSARTLVLVCSGIKVRTQAIPIYRLKWGTVCVRIEVVTPGMADRILLCESPSGSVVVTGAEVVPSCFGIVLPTRPTVAEANPSPKVEAVLRNDCPIRPKALTHRPGPIPFRE